MNSRKADFERNGYLVLDDFYTHSQCDELVQRAKELSNGLEGKDEVSIFKVTGQSKSKNQYFFNSAESISYFFENDAFDENGIVRKPAGDYLSRIGYAMHDIDPVFKKFSRSKELKQLVNVDLQLEDQVIIQSVYIFKHARIGAGLHLHQDSSFTYTEPDSCVGFWFALEDANKENGCLWVQPGGHKTALRERFYRTEEGGTAMAKLDTTPFTMDDFIPLEVKKGACIVLHGLLPHYSLNNTSGQSRQAYAIHTISSKANYPKDNWLQRTTIPVTGF
jgi:phytanoyl-CoA hydroxylase